MVIIHKKHKETAEEKEVRQKIEQEQAMGVQDEYQSRGFELVSWVQDHKVMVSSLILLLFLAGGIFSAYLYYQERKSEAASGVFLEALKQLDTDDVAGTDMTEKKKKVQAELEQIATVYKGTGVSTLAGLYAAHLALVNGDTETSLKLYQGVLGSVKKGDALYPSAIIGLGYAQEKAGDTKAALASFESVIALKDAAGKDLALWEAARLSKDQSVDKAKEYVATLLEQYPQSVYEKNALRLKESLQ